MGEGSSPETWQGWCPSLWATGKMSWVLSMPHWWWEAVGHWEDVLGALHASLVVGSGRALGRCLGHSPCGKRWWEAVVAQLQRRRVSLHPGSAGGWFWQGYIDTEHPLSLRCLVFSQHGA